MIDPLTIAHRYVEVWNESDPAQRCRLMEASWIESASYVDPLMQAAGREQIGALIAAVQERFPGHLFTLQGQPDGYGNRVRFSWALASPGATAVAHGTDFGVIAEDGRLSTVTGFLDHPLVLA